MDDMQYWEQRSRAEAEAERQSLTIETLTLHLDRIEDHLLALESASKRIEAEMVDLRRAAERIDDKIDSFVLDVLDLKRRARREAQ